MAMLSNLDLIRRVPLFSLLTTDQAQDALRQSLGRQHLEHGRNALTRIGPGEVAASLREKVIELLAGLVQLGGAVAQQIGERSAPGEQAAVRRSHGLEQCQPVMGGGAGQHARATATDRRDPDPGERTLGIDEILAAMGEHRNVVGAKGSTLEGGR